MRSLLRNIRISPKKVNLVAGLVRRRSVTQAIAILKVLPKKAAKPLREAIQSAASNAVQNFKQKKENLIVQNIMVNKGPTLRRGRPVSRGRSHPIRKRMSHIRVEVAVKTAESSKTATKPDTKTS